jgi:hypothetical protein
MGRGDLCGKNNSRDIICKIWLLNYPKLINFHLEFDWCKEGVINGLGF